MGVSILDDEGRDMGRHQEAPEAPWGLEGWWKGVRIAGCG